MFDVPLQTHKDFIEPLSETKHLKKVLLKRFMGFLNQIEKSAKIVPKQLLSFIKRDANSTTGSNLRNFLMLTNKNDIDELTAMGIEDIKYNEIEENDKWKVAMIREITDIKFKQLELENFSIEE